MKFIITGGAGFIGSAVIRHIINNTNHNVVNVDKLTYAGNLESLKSIEDDSRYVFDKVDICDVVEIKRVFNEYQPDIVMHLAAESHVDRSINDANPFLVSNIRGAFNILDIITKQKKRMIQISTDEVFGSLETGTADEQSKMNPYSPYAATKAAEELLIN